MSSLASPVRNGRAVPVLTMPYPAPRVYESVIRKPEGSVGIAFKMTRTTPTMTMISSLSHESPLFGSSIQVGQQLLSINGIPVSSHAHAVSIIKDTQSSILTFVSCDAKSAPFCKMIISQSWDHHPGVAFHATRGRCLVQVYRVFSRGPLAETALKRDDLILAVNGVAVSKVEDADQALELSRGRPHTTIYAFDMELFRKDIVDEVKESNEKLKELNLDKQDYNDYFVKKESQMNSSIKARVCFDQQTQHLVNPELFVHYNRDNINESSDTYFRRPWIHYRRESYASTVRPFLEGFNESMENRLHALEEAVCCEAWKHRGSSSTGVTTIPSAPVAPETVTVEADYQVIPLADIQRLSERDVVVPYNHASY
jgi:hypothetical protein